MLGLQLHQPGHQPIVLAVADLGCGLDVIEIVVPVDLVSQRLDLVCDLLRRHRRPPVERIRKGAIIRFEIGAWPAGGLDPAEPARACREPVVGDHGQHTRHEHDHEFDAQDQRAAADRARRRRLARCRPAVLGLGSHGVGRDKIAQGRHHEESAHHHESDEKRIGEDGVLSRGPGHASVPIHKVRFVGLPRVVAQAPAKTHSLPARS